MDGHVTVEKKKTVIWKGQFRTENKFYKCIVATSGNPEKVYLETAERNFKKDIITLLFLSKLRHIWTKPPRQSMFKKKDRDIT